MALNLKTTATCAAALFAAGAAQADVTAQDVWDRWQEGLAVYGEEGITIGSQEMVGPSLTITDLTMSMTDPEMGDVEVTATIPSIVLTENGDGTVSVVMSESYPIRIIDSPQNQATVMVTQAGLDLQVSGTPDAMVYDISADKLSISLDEITDGGEPMQAEALLSLNGVSGNYTASYGDLNTVVYAVTTGGIDMLVDVSDPDGEGYLNFSGQIADLAIAGDISIPADMDYDAPESMFIDGFAVDTSYEFGQSAYLLDFMDGSDAANGTLSASNGTFGLSIDYDAVTYSTGFSDLAVNFTASDVPLPIEFSIAEYDMGIDMPLSSSETASPLGARFILRDLAISDMIWGMVDPGASLPHDPLTVAIELSGMGRLFFDMMDPAQAMQATSGSDLPGELDSLSLDDLTIRGAGAEILGSGAFTFDFTDFQTIPGAPRPEGELNLAINGVNGLIDTLVQMGLVPEQQVMGAQMMMGAFTRPVGEDMLETTIEINSEGHILANGQRLQ
ncbi:DUF2125 domain-containing protein [Ponticoccus sp. SC2-23]|uniref:DUF2125 domain-containing protein n=1 Tax=Alexandriicola marinus TaxID=2081710 RepID=UPI000FDAEAA1|nr:DUF2125 domain-containing protein [Alexandriicola marinus]MBM1221831.1 DUF2125 domain-containing protein [Ponticoccus sp. SC6-9]MBM1226182.1 DUF2125 domain-containing protein [Ponticoccus sp. SC6-15]MBM1230778.1 DUF2125 domain-containing protein [Ponticoccus sp. SC6-38]MBM1235381.1 DUF2125 domain-containing protein [Ponticoccus sp. SC6-45]MBM1239800.1 DUF2125 domain-containing protein [Ponticoccus sp. SC6-49]MBM1243944.1 DUF2125 domain-containing protein [Ponticoccus sp. SC2-64]MBM1248905